MKSALAIFICALFSASIVSAQDLQEIDGKLASILAELDTAAMTSAQISEANDRIADLLVGTASAVPASISAPFSHSVTEQGLTVITATDGNVRIYCWDTRQAPVSQAVMASVLQWRTARGVAALAPAKMNVGTADDYEIDGDCKSIQSIKTRSGRTVYLLSYHCTFLPNEWQETIASFTIDHDSLVAFPLFVTNGTPSARISYRYDPSQSKPNVMHFEHDQLYLYIPVVNGPHVTDKYRAYKSDGENYVFDKNLR